MNSISFGKVFRVNASANTAEKLVAVVNNSLGQNFDAAVHPVSDSESYIFTGNEAIEYKKSQQQAENADEIAYSYMADCPVADDISVIARAKHQCNVLNILDKQSGQISKLNVSQDNDGNIKSINVII